MWGGGGFVVFPGYAFTESLLLFEGSLRELCHRHDLLVLEYCLLEYLNEDCNDKKLSDVASDLLVSPSHLACAIRSLMRRSDILKKRSGIDRRVFSLDLTTAGFTSMERISNPFYQIIKAHMLCSPIEHMAVSKIVHLNLDYLRNQCQTNR
jgi:DNA-binding MarR family transcriptional regulator